MKKVLSECYINEKNKEGQPFIDKSGNPYKMCNVKFEGDDNRYSMFIGSKYGLRDYETVSQWQPGMEVDVVLEQNGQYWNFKLPTKTDGLAERIGILENFVRKIVMLNRLKIKEEKSNDDFGEDIDF